MELTEYLKTPQESFSQESVKKNTMHEFFIVQNIIKTVEELLINYPDKKVSKMVLVIGKFSGIEPELLKTALEFFKKGTCLEEAEIVFELKELKFRCKNCNKKFSREKWIVICPYCQSLDTEVIEGEEMILKTIELVDVN